MKKSKDINKAGLTELCIDRDHWKARTLALEGIIREAHDACPLTCYAVRDILEKADKLD